MYRLLIKVKVVMLIRKPLLGLSSNKVCPAITLCP